MSFSMGRLYKRISTAKPSALVFSTFVVGFAVFLFGGGLYDIIMAPYPAVYYQNRFLIVYPGLSEQFIGDSLVAMILYGLGTFGLILMYQSTKHAYKPRQAYMMFSGGVIFLLVAYIVLEATIRLKSG